MIVLFIHSFRMPLFFLLSGFFAALLVEKYGMRAAFRNRVERIGLPFLIAVVTIVPVAGWLTLSFGISADAGRRLYFTASPEQLEWAKRLAALLYEERNRLPTPAHLWFLYFLLLFYPLMPLCRAAASALARSPRAVTAGRAAASPWLPFVLGLWTAATLWPYRGAFAGLTYLRPTLSSLVYYATFFVTGYLFHSFRGFLSASERHLRAYALTSGLLFAVSLRPSRLDFRIGGSDLPLHTLTVVVNGLLTWALIYASIGLFQRFFDRDSPWIAYISQSSYWVYLVHLPLASLAGWWLVTAAVPAVLKFVLAAAFTTIASFLSYHYLARRTWISVMLNGRRFSLRWPWLEPLGGAYSVPLGADAARATISAR